MAGSWDWTGKGPSPGESRVQLADSQNGTARREAWSRVLGAALQYADHKHRHSSGWSGTDGLMEAETVLAHAIDKWARTKQIDRFFSI